MYSNVFIKIWRYKLRCDVSIHVNSTSMLYLKNGDQKLFQTISFNEVSTKIIVKKFFIL
jgi:hypothetical protein